MKVFGAMLLDAYRELNSKKLFWIIMAISGLVVLVYGSIGFDDKGMSFFFGIWSVENEFLTRDSPLSSLLYRSLFVTFLVGIWLAWAATILALVSTTTIFPDFISGGAIDLVLSKPISRLRLFVFKYLTSLLFVLLQVTVVCVGIFICMGLRLSDWEPRVFLAIPILTLFFSFLYSVNVLIGVMTRSALTALLLTMLLWVGLFTINQAEGTLNFFKLQAQETVKAEQDMLDSRAEEIESIEDETRREVMTERLAEQQENLDKQVSTMNSLDTWHTGTRAFQFIMPKTSETINLLDRWLRRDTDVNFLDILSGNATLTPDGEMVVNDQTRERKVTQALDEDYRSRSVWYILGTSLGFEFVVLGLAALIFIRRDY